MRFNPSVFNAKIFTDQRSLDRQSFSNFIIILFSQNLGNCRISEILTSFSYLETTFNFLICLRILIEKIAFISKQILEYFQFSLTIRDFFGTVEGRLMLSGTSFFFVFVLFVEDIFSFLRLCSISRRTVYGN